MGTMNNIFDYSPGVWTRFGQTPHAGRLREQDAGVVSVQVGSKAARSLLKLQVQREPLKARFLAYGCPTAIAVGQWVCEQIEGQGPAALSGITAPLIRQALEIPEDRIHCALMGEDAIKALLPQL